MGVTAFVAAFLLLYLPETKDRPTAETLDDIDTGAPREEFIEMNSDKELSEDNTKL